MPASVISGDTAGFVMGVNGCFSLVCIQMLSRESANDQERFPPSMVNACSELQQAIISVMAKCNDGLILWSAKNGKSFEKARYLQDTKLCGLRSARAANLPERFYADPTWWPSFLSAPFPDGGVPKPGVQIVISESEPLI